MAEDCDRGEESEDEQDEPDFYQDDDVYLQEEDNHTREEVPSVEETTLGEFLPSLTPQNRAKAFRVVRHLLSSESKRRDTAFRQCTIEIYRAIFGALEIPIDTNINKGLLHQKMIEIVSYSYRWNTSHSTYIPIFR